MIGLTTYSKGSKFFHWLIALLVIVMLSIGFFLGDFPEKLKASAYMLHQSLGISIFFLMWLRIFWLWYTGRPELPVTVPVWQKILARTVQYFLYVFVILMPLSGWIMSTASKYPVNFFGITNFSFPGVGENQSLSELMWQFHSTIALIIIGLLFFHISGAIKHHFIDKDNVVRRMWPGK